MGDTTKRTLLLLLACVACGQEEKIQNLGGLGNDADAVNALLDRPQLFLSSLKRADFRATLRQDPELFIAEAMKRVPSRLRNSVAVTPGSSRNSRRRFPTMTTI